MNFSEKLQILRKNKGLTQEALADKLNVSRQAVAKWKSGQAYPDTYVGGEYTYKCSVNGDFTWFQGYEEIYFHDKKVYECFFHGGVMK